MKRKRIYSGVVFVLVAYLLAIVLYLFGMLCPRAALPLTQRGAERIGGEILRTSYPHLFDEMRVGKRKQKMDIKAVDVGDAWEVYIHSDSHVVEIPDGRFILPGYYTRYVILDKATGNVVRFGEYN